MAGKYVTLVVAGFCGFGTAGIEGKRDILGTVNRLILNTLLLMLGPEINHFCKFQIL